MGLIKDYQSIWRMMGGGDVECARCGVDICIIVVKQLENNDTMVSGCVMVPKMLGQYKENAGKVVDGSLTFSPHTSDYP